LKFYRNSRSERMNKRFVNYLKQRSFHWFLNFSRSSSFISINLFRIEGCIKGGRCPWWLPNLKPPNKIRQSTNNPIACQKLNDNAPETTGIIAFHKNMTMALIANKPTRKMGTKKNRLFLRLYWYGAFIILFFYLLPHPRPLSLRRGEKWQLFSIFFKSLYLAYSNFKLLTIYYLSTFYPLDTNLSAPDTNNSACSSDVWQHILSG